MCRGKGTGLFCQGKSKCHPAHHADTVCRLIFPNRIFPFKANTFSLFVLCRSVTVCIFGHYFTSEESWQH